MNNLRFGMGNGMLGQVPIRAGTGFTDPLGPFGQPPTQGYFRAPSGAPLYSEEERSPTHVEEERHCYSCPDGTKRYMTLPEARATACEARPYSECAGGASLYGGRRGDDPAHAPFLGQVRLGQFGWTEGIQEAFRRASDPPPPDSGGVREALEWHRYWFDRHLPEPPFKWRYTPPIVNPLPPRPAPRPVETPITQSPYPPVMTPGSVQAQGLPCPAGQHRPPGGGWCVPDEGDTAWRPFNYGAYGGLINMSPGSTGFNMTGRIPVANPGLSR